MVEKKLVEIEPEAQPVDGQIITPDEWFSLFWQAYPRKVAKPRASKAFAKQVKAGVDPHSILTGLKAHLPELESREPHFVPHPATWLNDERFNDPPMKPIQKRRTVFDAAKTYIDGLNRPATDLERIMQAARDRRSWGERKRDDYAQAFGDWMAEDEPMGNPTHSGPPKPAKPTAFQQAWAKKEKQ